eukprot:3446055-Rhodomonas_salina.2
MQFAKDSSLDAISMKHHAQLGPSPGAAQHSRHCPSHSTNRIPGQQHPWAQGGIFQRPSQSLAASTFGQSSSLRAGESFRVDNQDGQRGSVPQHQEKPDSPESNQSVAARFASVGVWLRSADDFPTPVGSVVS